MHLLATAAFVCVSFSAIYCDAADPVDPDIHPLFESVKYVKIENTTVTATGYWPEWLHASKYNNGFGVFESGEGKEPFEFKYLFDVMGYIAKWRVDGSDVSFSSDVIDSDYYREGLIEIPTYRTFGGTEPEMSLRKKLAVLTSDLSDNLNVNIQKFGERIVALSDSSGAMEIDAQTVETIGLLEYNDSLTGQFEVVTSAHPSRLAGDQYWYNYQLSILGNTDESDPSKLNSHQIIRTDTSNGNVLTREKMMEVPISQEDIGYVHSFAHTPNYMVFFHFPLKWNVLRIPLGTEILPTLNWEPEDGTLVWVIDKRTWTVVKKLRTVPMFAYHHVNAYEDPVTGDVVADITTVPCDGADESQLASCLHMNAFELETLRTGNFDIPRGQLLRFNVPTAPSNSTEEEEYIKPDEIGTASFDLPMMNENYRGYKHRYVYGAGNTEKDVASSWYDAIIKVDMETGESTEWYTPGHYPSEPNFVPRPGAVDEDDGVLLTTVLAKELGTSYLQVLDAKTLEPLGRAEAPMYLPFPSHGFVEQDPFDVA